MAKSKTTIAKGKGSKAKVVVLAHAAKPAASKKDKVINLLGRSDGVSIEEITAVTDWLPHSTRAVLSGFRKAGREIVRSKDDGGVTRYRFA